MPCRFAYCLARETTLSSTLKVSFDIYVLYQEVITYSSLSIAKTNPLLQCYDRSAPSAGFQRRIAESRHERSSSQYSANHFSLDPDSAAVDDP